MLIQRTQLVLVNVTYYRPDFPSLLQDFIWQTDDIVPDIPRVHRFLLYWKKNIHATINRVIVCSAERNWRQVLE